MSEAIYKDSSIHKDGIYDIDKNCYLTTGETENDDGIVFALLIVFVFFQFLISGG